MIKIDGDIETRTSFEERKKVFFRPCLIVLSGVPLTGKTVLAEKLVNSSNLQMLDVDTVRDEIDESRRNDLRIRMLKPEQEKAVMIKAYTEMCQRAENFVSEGIPVVISGTFSRSEFKQPLEYLINILRRKGIPLKIFLLTVSDEEALKRIGNRKKDDSPPNSNIDSFEKYQWAKGIFSRIKFTPTIEIDTLKADYIEQTLTNLEELKVNS